MNRRPHRSAPRSVRLAVALAASLAGLIPFVTHVPAATAAPVTNRPCVNGLAGSFTCKGVDLEVFIPMADLGGGEASDVWGWRDPATDHEYALMGSTRGLMMVDITKPSQPVYLGNLLKPDGQFVWQDVEVYKDHAFVVCDLAPCGMQVFDLTRLRGVTTPQNWTPDVVYPVTMSTHSLDIDPETGFGYLNGAYLAAPTHIVDVNIPKAPVPVGFISDDGYTHDSFCRIYRGPDTRFSNKEICFNFNEDTITIYDVSNKSAIVQLARVTYPGASYVHSGWLTQDSRYLLSTDETDNKNIVFVWDVSLLDAPRQHFNYTGTTAAIDHNPYIKGRWAYLANYRAGMRVLDTANVAGGTLTEIAYFDVLGGPNTAGYDGAWTVYPFLPSGNVLISGMNQGLFVVDPTFDDPAPNPLETGVAVKNVSRDGSALTVGGVASFADQPFVAHGTDPAGDSTAPGVLGQDLAGAATAATSDGRLKLRWQATQFPPGLGGPGPRVMYGRAFCVAGAGDEEVPVCWEIDTWSSGTGDTNPFVEVWSCGDEACTPASQSLTSIAGTGSFDPTTTTVTTRVRLADLGIAEGGSLTPVDPGGQGSVWTGVNDYYADGDATAIDTSYDVPSREVALAIGAPGQDPATVAYSAAATLGADGAFEGQLDISGLTPGAYAAYVQACFGANNCGYATSPVTI